MKPLRVALLVLGGLAMPVVWHNLSTGARQPRVAVDMVRSQNTRLLRLRANLSHAEQRARQAETQLLERVSSLQEKLKDAEERLRRRQEERQTDTVAVADSAKADGSGDGGGLAELTHQLRQKEAKLAEQNTKLAEQDAKLAEDRRQIEQLSAQVAQGVAIPQAGGAAVAAAPATATATATATAAATSSVAAAAVPVPAAAGGAVVDDGRNLLLATRSEPAGKPPQQRRLLRALLGMASLLNRTLVLPAAWCKCADPAALTGCDSSRPAHPLFGCSLRNGLAGNSAPELWPATAPPALMLRALPDALRCTHVRVALPLGLDSEQLTHALRHYATTRILEVDAAAETYCGPSPRATAAELQSEASFDAIIAAHGGSERALPACLHSLKEEEVSQYWDMGKCEEHEVKVALPESIRSMPRGADLLVTFATGSVATMAHNWVAALRKAGVVDGVVIGALDQSMLDACAVRGLPCVSVDGGAVTAALKQRKAENVRADPKLYPKMSVLKVGFYRELLKLGFNVWACDADAIFMSDPRPLVRSVAWAEADVAVATDCIDLPGDARAPLLHCDFNTGLVFLRASKAVLDFTEQWREKVANAKEARIRDQAAFNMITKAPPGLRPYVRPDGSKVPRIYLAGSGGTESLRLGVFPLTQFLNGHTFFVQHAHQLPGAAQPVSVHMTYQFAEGASFAYGKRQRLRESGLWFVDPDDYYNGRYVTVSAEVANALPIVQVGVDADSRVAVQQHLKEHAHALKLLRTLLGIGKALGRDVIMPRLMCYCDYMWKEMKSCRVGGAETMRLPFDCPMDHVLDTPRFFENTLGVGIREPAFLSNPRVPANVTSSIAKASIPKGQALNDEGIRAALAQYAGAGIIELQDAVDVFCGFADQVVHAQFLAETERVLSYKRVPFCTMEGSDNAPLYSRCCEPWHPGEKFFPCVEGFDGPEALPACSAAG